MARAGDTITLAVGSPDKMDLSNTTVLYRPDADPANPIDLTGAIRAIFKIYPDRTSPAWLDEPLVDVLSSAIFTGHSAWQQVIAIDLPVTLSDGVTPFPVGTGQAEVSISAGQYAGQPYVGDYPIALEILPGTGAPGTFTHSVFAGTPANVAGNLSELEPLPQVRVKPGANVASMWGSEIYAAVEFTLDIPANTNSPDPVEMFVVRNDFGRRDLESQIHATWVSNCNETRVILVSPNGMQVLQTRFSVLASTNSTTTLLDTSTPTVTLVRFFDLNGLETAIAPTAADYEIKLIYNNQLIPINWRISTTISPALS